MSLVLLKYVINCSCLKGVYDVCSQGRNHGIDIGGVQKFSRGSDRKNKQARPSTNE